MSLGLALFTAAVAGPAAAADPPPAAAPAAAPAPAPAAAPAPPPAAGDAGDAGAKAAQLYQEGNAFYDQGKYTQAETRYQAAWDLQKSFDVAGNLGNVEMLIGQHRDAAEHLSYALQTFPLGGTPEKKRFLQERLAEARKQIGTVRITVNVDGAEILIDGKWAGVSPLPGEVFVPPGERTIEVRRGRLKSTESILVAKGSSQDLRVTLQPGPKKEILIAGGAVGAAGIASGVIFAILSSGKAGDAEELPLGSPERVDLRDSQTTLANVSFWSFVGGGLALAGTGVYWLVTASEPAPTPGPVRSGLRVRAAPVVTAEGGGVMIGGSF